MFQKYLSSHFEISAMQYFSYLLLRLFVFKFSLLSFRVLYVFSDLLSFVLHRVIGYRQKVVSSNLHRCFPDKTESELQDIEKKFYRHLGDITIETLKGMSMSANDFKVRHKILNPEVCNYYFDKGQSIIGVTAHYGNWEWGTNSPGVQIKSEVIALYKPLTNKYVDSYMRRLREKFNARLTPILETFQVFSHYQDKAVSFVLAADQSPVNLKRAYWIDFLGQDTACLHGPEKYARMFNLPVVYVHIERVKRGFYEISLKPLCDSPAELAEGEITRLYMKELESHILSKPENWLWSHRRWKHSRS